jgi:hypothetical protein
MKLVQGAGGPLTQMSFEFGESQFNGVEIGAVGWQVADANTPTREKWADDLDFVGGEVVEDERAALAQLRTERLLKIGREDIGIDWSFDQERGFDAFVAQGRNEGGGLPVAVRDGAETTLTHRAATMVAGHLGVQTRFIDKNQMTNVPAGLLPSPKLAGGFDIRAVLLGGARRFFYSSGPVA